MGAPYIYIYIYDISRLRVNGHGVAVVRGGEWGMNCTAAREAQSKERQNGR